MSWQKAMILNPNEQVLHSWDGNCERQHKAVVAQKGLIFTNYKTVQSKEVHRGTLVLTNQRMLWFERRGFLSKTQRASFEIDLRNLKGVTCGGTIMKWVSITDTDGESIFHLDRVGKKEIEPFRDMILRQVEKVKGGNSETLNVNIRKEIIKTEGIPPIWNCPYCKGVNFQTLTECKHCGAPRKTDSEGSFFAADQLQSPEKQNKVP
jgi:hypothetical protein